MKAKGLCPRHYEAARTGRSGKPGRPAQYPDELREKYGGAPSISVRLDPETWEAVKERGGSAWVRQVVQDELEREGQTEAGGALRRLDGAE